MSSVYYLPVNPARRDRDVEPEGDATPPPKDGDGDGPVEYVIRIELVGLDEPVEVEPEEDVADDPPAKERSGWGWFFLGALLGFGLGG
jgi:hypothetical protein